MGNEELEQRWRSRLDDAKLRLDYATSYGNGRDDGWARKAHETALAEYTRVLRIFTELVVDGKTPDGAQHNIDGHSPLSLPNGTRS